MNDYLKNKFKVWWLGSCYIFLTSGFLTTLYIYFVKRNIDIKEILLAEFFGAVTVSLIIFYKRKWHTHHTFWLAFSLMAIALLILFLPLPIKYLLILYTAVAYSGTILFFVPFNVLFFKEGNKSKNLQHITFYWAIMIIGGIVGPLVGGYLLASVNLIYFVLVSFLILLFVVCLVKYLPVEIYLVEKKKLFSTLKGFRTITILDGALHKVNTITIVILSLQFITNAFSFGKFLSLVSLVALVFSWQTAKISDRLNQRMFFLWPLCMVTGLVTFSLYFATSFYLFVALALVLKALTIMLEPMRSNILQDKADKNNPLTWISRELFLNSGRSVLWLTAFVLWYFNWQSLLFIIMGSLYLIFPILVRYKNVYVAKSIIPAIN
ncbi:MAG: hypothetical protein US42_C0002G0087 [Candidatus Magasanikbacteria bacterium GW2011_GWC2_37_14]|uniref:MFS transporter n=1 Tax=Candidatus Magasanikbacteria bacterium GW2011_GWC2_37_14 TaxID=1619046 RepID=A0A0G0GDT3_9BACT|nr:MAG: hypothetical protein US42_C0002G0087 [Candidatus Magasanikbacteria bacterium GW2011_GWC2_37_14]